MGWDAYAVRKRGGDAVFDLDEKKQKLFIPDPTLRKAFAKAAGQAKKLGGWADRLLENGGLDLVECACMLERLTGISAWGDDLSPEAVQKLEVKTFKPERNRAWAYYSALKFLETCKSRNLGIEFSW